jgi:hypothetical protein
LAFTTGARSLYFRKRFIQQFFQRLGDAALGDKFIVGLLQFFRGPHPESFFRQELDEMIGDKTRFRMRGALSLKSYSRWRDRRGV